MISYEHDLKTSDLKMSMMSKWAWSQNEHDLNEHDLKMRHDLKMSIEF